MAKLLGLLEDAVTLKASFSDWKGEVVNADPEATRRFEILVWILGGGKEGESLATQFSSPLDDRNEPGVRKSRRTNRNGNDETDAFLPFLPFFSFTGEGAWAAGKEGRPEEA